MEVVEGYVKDVSSAEIVRMSEHIKSVESSESKKVRGEVKELQRQLMIEKARQAMRLVKARNRRRRKKLSRNEEDEEEEEEEEEDEEEKTSRKRWDDDGERKKTTMKNRLEEEYRLANASDTTKTNTTLDEELCSVPS
jgi:hypothetical protein